MKVVQFQANNLKKNECALLNRIQFMFIFLNSIHLETKNI